VLGISVVGCNPAREKPCKIDIAVAHGAGPARWGDIHPIADGCLGELPGASVTLLCAGVFKSPTPSCRFPADLLLMLSAD
jgi:hypothetical protein